MTFSLEDLSPVLNYSDSVPLLQVVREEETSGRQQGLEERAGRQECGNMIQVDSGFLKCLMLFRETLESKAAQGGQFLEYADEGPGLASAARPERWFGSDSVGSPY